MEKIIKELKEKQNIRNNLSNLRAMIKDEKSKLQLEEIVHKDLSLWIDFLKNEDAKTRKNAALLLGDVKEEAARDAIWDAYVSEQTLFVKSAYLAALKEMDMQDKLLPLHEKEADLISIEQTPENQKHIEEELRVIRKILIAYEGISRHVFQMEEACDVILTTNRIHKEVLRRLLMNLDAKAHPLGVIVHTNQIKQLYQIRCFKDMLFPVNTKELLPEDPKKAASLLMEADLVGLLEKLHRGDGAFYFRIDISSKMDLEARSLFAKRLATALEKISNQQLINSASDYEVEIRLISNKDGMFYPVVKCSANKDMRFAYRKNTVSASIAPSTAALIMELAKPYLKENAQIMDPFCGVGTMLIERNQAVCAREMYATDIFGEAIEKGRENSSIAKCRINFIHRDFFDFKHEYLFDEIITNMPIRGKRTREEMDTFYSQFFSSVQRILARDAVIIMYTNEVGFVKKQLRLHKEFSLLQETLMQDKNDFYLLVIGVTR